MTHDLFLDSVLSLLCCYTSTLMLKCVCSLCYCACDKDGSVCGISNDCGIPRLTCLASQCGNERAEQKHFSKQQQQEQGWGLRGGFSQGRLEGLGAGWRGTDGSIGSGLFWANSWKQTHITHMLLCSRLLFCSDCDFLTVAQMHGGARNLCRRLKVTEHSFEVFPFLFFYTSGLHRTRDEKRK